MSGLFSFGVPGGAITAVVLAVLFAAAVAAAVWELRDERRPLRRRGLIAARVASALLVWFVASQPTWASERFDESEGGLALLVDASRSMSLPRGEGSRARRAASLLSRWASETDRPLSAFTFGEQLSASRLGELGTSVPATEDQSQLGGALSSVLEGARGGDLGAVVVVSDGAVSPLDLDGLARRGVRVHAVALAEEDLRDDAIAEVEADPVGFLRRTARVRVVVRSLGGRGGPIPVTLRRGDEVEREVIAEVPEDGEVSVEIPFTPQRLGREVYRVSIPAVSDDAVPENNERAFLVRVTRDKLRVLLVAGQPSWDQRFLRAFLKRDPATDLISFFILRNTSDMTMAGPEELALIPFPTDELFNEHLGSFDLVVFQNFEYGPYQMAGYLPRIRDYVMRGGSFAMVGGPISFHSGGYAGTPIAEILPVELPPSGAPESETIVTDRFAPRLTPGVERHPLLGLAPDPAQNAAAWAGLARLQGANVVTRVRPDSMVLLEHPTHEMETGGGLPLLVVGQAGRGRVLALTTDTTWRWGITTGGETGDASAYERFWDRAVRWLARDPVLEPARLTTDRERYGPGARARIDAVLREASYAPHAERAVRFLLRDGADAEVAQTTGRTDREGHAEVSLALPDAPGAYRVEARFEGEDEPVAEEWLVVEAGGDELADPRAHPDRLAALAEATGGTFAEGVDDAPALDGLDTTRRRSLGVIERAPFASGWAFAAMLVALLAEWVLRRRWGRR
ncbi:MAG: glutamine amidotransferase [Sandaracinaceae bacterium]